jgi:mono/diheme cytochrome c family protein
MKVKYLAYAVIFVMTVSILWAQENKQQEKTPPPATTSQPAPTPAAQAPATGTEAVPAPAVPHGFTISPEEAARKNPVRFSEISVERGKKIFQTQCVMCHGEKGDGKGDLATEMKLKIPDFEKPDTLAKRTDGELFTIIQVGNPEMPGQGKRMNDTYKWELVNYLRSLSGKTPLKSTDEELQQGTVVVQEKENPKEEKEKPKPKVKH